ncbi:hypothetical protein C518_2412 [Lysinibacillus fusiformis ZB2]|nr:hypothetical protein C518_2412 [Lysinibacillus fusiformis ZB2]
MLKSVDFLNLANITLEVERKTVFYLTVDAGDRYDQYEYESKEDAISHLENLREFYKDEFEMLSAEEKSLEPVDEKEDNENIDELVSIVKNSK